MKRKKSTEDGFSRAPMDLLMRDCAYQCFVGFALRYRGEATRPDVINQYGPIRIAGGQMRGGG